MKKPQRGAAALTGSYQRENFLYFKRFGSSASAPKRRFLSSS
jgi:hypothetical protein